MGLLNLPALVLQSVHGDGLTQCILLSYLKWKRYLLDSLLILLFNSASDSVSAVGCSFLAVAVT